MEGGRICKDADDWMRKDYVRLYLDEATSLCKCAMDWKVGKSKGLADTISHGKLGDSEHLKVKKELEEWRKEFDSASLALQRMWNDLLARNPDEIGPVEVKRKEILHLELAMRLNSSLCSMKLKEWGCVKRSCNEGLERLRVAGEFEAITRTQKAKLLYRLGKACMEIGELDDAEIFLQNATEADPDTLELIQPELRHLKSRQSRRKFAERESCGRIFNSKSEIYDAGDRALPGVAFPAYRDRDMSRGLDRINLDEEFRQIEEEEQKLRQRQENLSRMKVVDTTYKGNPWDPTGEKQQQEIDDYYKKMFAEFDSESK